MTDKTLFATIDGVDVWRHHITSDVMLNSDHGRYCAICEKPILPGEPMSLLVSDLVERSTECGDMTGNKLFPNVFVKTKHINEDKYDQEWACRLLMRKYKMFLYQYDKRRIWGIHE